MESVSSGSLLFELVCGFIFVEGLDDGRYMRSGSCSSWFDETIQNAPGKKICEKMVLCIAHFSQINRKIFRKPGIRQPLKHVSNNSGKQVSCILRWLFLISYARDLFHILDIQLLLLLSLLSYSVLVFSILVLFFFCRFIQQSSCFLLQLTVIEHVISTSLTSAVLE